MADRIAELLFFLLFLPSRQRSRGIRSQPFDCPAAVGRLGLFARDHNHGPTLLSLAVQQVLDLPRLASAQLLLRMEALHKAFARELGFVLRLQSQVLPRLLSLLLAQEEPLP